MTLDWSSTPNHVQQPTEYFWIDQICVDQDNAPEKSQQIQRMGDIFSRAQLVISWLGPEDRSSLSTRLAMSGFPLWQQYLRATHQPITAIGFPLLKVFKQEISAFLSRSYWSRLWIIQELVLSKAHFFLCGDWVITPNDLFPIYASGEFQDWELSFWNVQTEARGIMDIPSSLPKLVGLFHWTGEWHCQRPHDKVYGLLGLAKERMEVDYTKSLQELAGAVLEMAEPLMAADLKYWVSRSIHLVDALEKALEVDLHTSSTVPKLWAKVLKGKSNSDREIVLKESTWDHRDEWKLMKVELMTLLNS
jgi:Heterokaryon incompatibility protein (HET)